MKNRVRSISTILLASALLAGCSGTQQLDEPVADAATAENGDAQTTQAFMFESGALEIGDFDPYALGDDLFDPCTEISPAEFAAAGFENVEPIAEELRGLNPEITACFFSKHPETSTEALNNNNASRREIHSRGLILDQFKSEILPSLFVYGPKSGVGVSCYAQVDTTRGGLVSVVGGLAQYSDQSENCAIAIENLESLYLSLLRS